MTPEQKEETKKKIEARLYEHLGFNGVDGTYIFILTRAKEAFGVGTMSLDDFVEIDGDFVGELADLFVEMQSPAQTALEEAEQQIKEWQDEAKQWRDDLVAKIDELGEVQQTIAQMQIDADNLYARVRQDEQTLARQREALEQIAYPRHSYHSEAISTARAALEESAKEEWEFKIKPGDKVLVNFRHLKGQELPVSANHAHKRLISVIAPDGLWNVAYGDFERAGEGEKTGV